MLRYVTPVTLLLLTAGHMPPPAAPARCSLTPQDKLANTKLSFAEFDHGTATPSTGRALADRECYAQAAEAREDFLARAPVDSERMQTSLIFHLAQDLAMAGDHRKAASVVLGAKRTSQTDLAFDWNSYVVGTWAFLRGDRALLDDRYRHLSALPGHPNQSNAKVLGGLLRCFGKPYVEAYTPKCVGPR